MWHLVRTLLLVGVLLASPARANLVLSDQGPNCTLVADLTFTADPSSGWSFNPASTDPTCPVRWVDATDSIEREILAACSNTKGFARYNTDIGTVSMAVAIHASAFDDGTGTDPFEFPGIFMRGQSTAGNRYEIGCEDGLTCSSLFWINHLSTGSVDQGTSTCSTFGAPAVPGWIGAYLHETSATTDHLEVSNMGNASVPGHPSTWAARYGPPECKFDGWPTGAVSADKAGSRVGILLDTNTVGVGGEAQVDRIIIWACRP